MKTLSAISDPLSASEEKVGKMLMSDFRDKHKGQAAAVLGGGPSLPEDMKRLPQDCVLIAVNYHALHLVKPDYLVFNDQTDSDPLLKAAVDSTLATRVSPYPESDILFDVGVWTGHYSSNTATWFALWCGCDPVILCGMDCYQGDRVYFHEYSHDSPAFHYPLEDQLRPWQEEGKNRLPHVERVRVMSGPLTRVFKAYEGKETTPLPPSEANGEKQNKSKVPIPGPSLKGRGRKEAR